MGKIIRILLVLLIFLGLVALSCNTDPTVAGWLEEGLNVFGMNTPQLRTWIVHHPKLWHVLYYYVFCSVSISLVHRSWWLAPLLVFAIGVVLEITQIFVPTRSARLPDLMFNLAGILLAVVCAWGVRRLRSSKIKNSMLTGEL